MFKATFHHVLVKKVKPLKWDLAVYFQLVVFHISVHILGVALVNLYMLSNKKVLGVMRNMLCMFFGLIRTLHGPLHDLDPRLASMMHGRSGWADLS